MAAQNKSVQLAAYWQKQVADWQASGHSQKTFCEANDLNFHRFGYWRRKLLHQEDTRREKDSGFVPVTLHSQPPPTALSIQLPNGLVLQGIGLENLELVCQLLSRLS